MIEQATEFEKKRGLSRVEVRDGFAQVHVSRLAGNVMDERLRVLKAIADVSISIDFLKLTPSGLSFLVPEDRSSDVERALEPLGVHYSVRKGRSIVLVHAVNMRDEEGLIARIIETTIASGAKLDHVGDMHDRVLMVLEQPDAKQLAALFESKLEAAHV